MPSKAGVYKFLDSRNQIIYVGKAIDLKSRVSSYFTNRQTLGPKTLALVDQIKKIKITIVESELEALLLEAFYIKKYRPKYNIMQKDNKTFVRIKITLKDPYPAVTLARREEDGKAVYFGPYPSSRSVKLVLKTIRRVFPYVSAPNHAKRICLYHHLGLCPCPPVFASDQLSREYKKNIRGITRILEGQSRNIIGELEKNRDTKIKSEQYEEAREIQKKIDALSLITTPFHKPFEYHLNPNLRLDIRQKEISGLIEAINPQGLNLKKLNRIECYDISNTQGTNPTASMVVMTNGEIDKSQYRKFKMRTPGPNDFAMMQEVLHRRLKHKDWPTPDLIIVDGGKGQVSSAMKILQSNNSNIPLIGLAKREETIIIPVYHSGAENFAEVSLPKNSPALHLIMRIRDEAHRFAITYHKKLRSISGLS